MQQTPNHHEPSRKTPKAEHLTPHEVPLVARYVQAVDNSMAEMARAMPQPSRDQDAYYGLERGPYGTYEPRGSAENVVSMDAYRQVGQSAVDGQLREAA